MEQRNSFAPYCPIPRATALRKGLQSGRYAQTGIGLERICPQCKESWPADTEFFFPAPNTATGMHCYCKACYIEGRIHGRTKQAA